MATDTNAAIAEFVERLATIRCETFTGPDADCIAAGRTPFAWYGADEACVPCMARAALTGTKFPRLRA